MIEKFAKLMREVLTPKSETISFGRFMSLLLSVFVLGWDTSYMVFAWRMNHHLPPGMAPFPLLPDAITLAAQGGFMTLFYGVTRTGDVLTAKKPGSQAPPPNSPQN